MVRQGSASEKPYWIFPGGVVEPGEVVSQALSREVKEETGLSVTGPPSIGFILQRVVDPDASAGQGETGYLSTVWLFEVTSWEGHLQPEDPDGLIHEARFMPFDEVVSRLKDLPWIVSETLDYLAGKMVPGSLILTTLQSDGSSEQVGLISPWSPGPE